MRQELGRDRQPGAFSLSHRVAQAHGIPIDDDRGQQIEPGHPEVLAFAGAVAVLALASDA